MVKRINPYEEARKILLAFLDAFDRIARMKAK